MSTTAPQARVVARTGKHIIVVCPYCHRRHRHTIQGEGHQRFSPGCGLLLNAEDRAAGYVFSTRKNRRGDTGPRPGNRPVVTMPHDAAN